MRRMDAYLKTNWLPDCIAYRAEAFTHWMRVPRQHRLHAMPNDLRQVGVVDACGAEVGDVAVAALVGADV